MINLGVLDLVRNIRNPPTVSVLIITSLVDKTYNWSRPFRLRFYVNAITYLKTGHEYLGKHGLVTKLLAELLGLIPFAMKGMSLFL